MARFRYHACGKEGEFEYRPGAHACPLCGAHDVQIVLSIAELPDDDPLIEELRRLAEEDEP